MKIIRVIFFVCIGLLMFFNCAPLTEEGNFKDPNISIINSTSRQNSSLAKNGENETGSNDDQEEKSADDKEKSADDEEKEEEEEESNDDSPEPIGEEFPSGPETPETGDPPITRRLY